MARPPSDRRTVDAVSAYLTEVFRQRLLTQRALEERSGVSQTNISDAKNGKKATDDTVEKIAEAMGVRSEDILNGSATAKLRSHRPAETPQPQRRVVADAGQARTNDPLFWSDFAKRPGNEAFDDIVEATLVRASEKGWTEAQTNGVLNIAAKHVGRSYAGAPFSHGDARRAVERGVAIVIDGRDPDDVLPPRLPAPAMVDAPEPLPPPPETPAQKMARLDREEKAAKTAARKARR